MIQAAGTVEERIARLERQLTALLAGNPLAQASLVLDEGTVDERLVTAVEMALAPEAAAGAQTAAGQALAVANGKTTTYVGDTAPAVPDGGHAVGDEWLATSPAGSLLNTWDGTVWAPKAWGAGALAAESVVAGTIAAGAVAAGTIAAGAIDGYTITGATVRTSDPAVPGGTQRVELSSAAGLRGIDSAGTVKTSINPATGLLTATDATLTGSLTVGTGNTVAKVDSSGFYAGHSLFASAPFRVSPAGVLVATSATVTGELRTAASGPRMVMRQVAAPPGVNEVQTGTLEMHDGQGGTPSSITATTTTSGGTTTRKASLKVGSLGSETGASFDAETYPGYSTLYARGDQFWAICPVFTEEFFSAMGGGYFGESIDVSAGKVNGGTTIGAGIQATATISTDSNVSAGGQVIIGASAPLSGDHAVRRDYITTRLEGGSATFTFPAANTTYSQTVTFAVGKATTPAVVVTAVSANPQNYFFSIGGLTNTSFTLYGRALVAGSASCRWIATAF